MSSYGFPNARTGYLFSAEVTLGEAAAVTTIAIPNGVRGFRLFPDAEIGFAVGENPEAPAELTAATIAVDDLSVGGAAPASVWSEKSLASGIDRDLRLVGATGGETVYVEFF